MKKIISSIFVLVLLLTGANVLTSNILAGETWKICPGSSVKCEVKVDRPDGTKLEVKSEKDKGSDALIIEQT